MTLPKIIWQGHGLQKGSSARVSQILLDKTAFIAKYEGRTKNKEIEQLIKRQIAGFEGEHRK